MCSAMGNRIQECFPTYPDGDIVKIQRSRLTWPYQQRPDELSFRIWTRYIKQCFIKSRNNRLPILGPWFMDNVINDNIWPAYYHHSSSLLLIPMSRRGDRFCKVEVEYQRGTIARISLSEQGENITELPMDCVPADFQRHTRNATFRFVRSQSTIAQSLEVPTLPMWKQVIIKHIRTPGASILDNVANNKDQTIYIITDGGVYDQNSTFGVIIINGTHIMLTNMGTLYSMENFKSSYRSELYGLLAGIVTLNTALRSRQQALRHPTKIKIHCDNMSLIKQISVRRKQRHSVNQHQDPERDIELQLLHEIRELEATNHNITLYYVPNNCGKKETKQP
jgi:hypothetical protein